MARADRHRFGRWLVAALAAGLTSTVGVPATAHADGDPASDVLATGPVFLGADSGATLPVAAALGRQVTTADDRGHALRVAVIATRADLGSVGAYWRRPQAYAAFLGLELPLTYHGELLVVMPNGFGVARDRRSVRTSLASEAPRHGEVTAAAAEAVTELTGVPAGNPNAAAVTSAPSPFAGARWWIPTGVSLVLIAAAWTLSLHVRPRQLRRRVHPRPHP